MSISWITPQGILVNDFEETPLSNIFIELETDGISLKLDSGTLPNGVSLYPITEKKYELRGKLPIVSTETQFAFTMRATIGEEVSDRYFIIVVKNKITEWDMPTDAFTYTETSYISLQMKLKNPIGNEVFFKESGEFPPNLIINNQGLIYGVLNELPITSEGKPDEKDYEFSIGVKQNKNIILIKQFSIKVLRIGLLNEPIWITESGNIGSLNYNQPSTLFVKAYDPNGEKLKYELSNDEQNLPSGLSVDIDNGKIIGRMISEFTQNWNFSITVTNESLNTSTREFSIKTNMINTDDMVFWESEPLLGDFKIGQNVYFFLKTKSNHKCYFTLISGSMPKGLYFDNSGEISGILDYQQMGLFKFVVEVSNGFMTIQREFTMNIQKGLGKNAVNCFFYINNEYLNSFGEMIGYFDRTLAFNTSNKKYSIESKPKIDICTLNCIDKTLMTHLLYFNTPIKIQWGNSKKVEYINENDDYVYNAFYKSLDENIAVGGVKQIHGNKIYIVKDGNIWRNEKTNEIIVPNNTIHDEEYRGDYYVIIDGKKYYVRKMDDTCYYEDISKLYVSYDENIYKEYIKDGKNIIENYYIIKNGNIVYVNKATDLLLLDIKTMKVLQESINGAPLVILQDSPSKRYYFIDANSFLMDYSSINGIREVLSHPIYVEKQIGDKIYYDIGTQEILDYPINDDEFIIKWDNDKKTYYVDYNGEIRYYDIYSTSDNTTYNSVEAEVDDIIYDVIKVQEEFDSVDINYKHYIITTKDGQIQEDIIFTTYWNSNTKFINHNGRVIFVKHIVNPWVYTPEKNPKIGRAHV